MTIKKRSDEYHQARMTANAGSREPISSPTSSGDTLSAEARSARSSASLPEGYRPIVGRKSGRVAPLAPLRQPAREATLVKHDLMEAGTGDTNQGQLFSSKQFERPVSQVAREAGVAPPLASSAGGFLAGIEASPTGKVSAHQRKVNAIQSFAETREANPIDVPHTGPGGHEIGQGARHMAHLQALGEKAPESPWYIKPKEGGGMEEGKALEGIRTAAAQTDSTMASMTRATAQISPRVPWSSGNANYRGMPNLETATNIGRSVRERESNFPGVKARESTLERLGQESGGIGLPLSKARAGVSLGRPETAAEPLPSKTEGSDKVPNFNESNSIAQEQIPSAVRAQYGGSYTSDMWDLSAKNLPEKFHAKQGQYEVDKMLSTRTAFKNRVMPAHLQSGIWSQERNEKDPEPLTASVHTGEGKYEPAPSLLRDDQFGKLSPSFDFSRNKEGSVPDPRKLAGGGTAARMGLDF